MDIKSIVRVFRFGELQSRAERDPTAKRPPTIMFMGLFVAIGLAVAGVGLVVSDMRDSGADGTALEVTDPVPTNETSIPAPAPEQESSAPGIRPGLEGNQVVSRRDA